MLIKPEWGRPAVEDQYQHDILALLPENEDLNMLYIDHIVPVAKSLGLTIQRPEDIFSSNTVMSQLWAAIFYSKILIADCSLLDPEVFYVLGIAHTIGKPVLLISQTTLPFDVRKFNLLKYVYEATTITEFETELKRRITILIAESSKTAIVAQDDGTLIVQPVWGPPSDDPQFHTDIFMAMPFRKELDKIYKKFILPRVTERNWVIKRGDDPNTTRTIMDDVWASINGARITVADCTGRNPNVFYEIGIAHALGKPVILIVQIQQAETSISSDIPLTLRDYRNIDYTTKPRDINYLLNELIKRLDAELSKLPSDLPATNKDLLAVSGYFDTGISNYEAGHYEAAIKDFSKILNIESHNTAALNNRGIARAQLGQFKQAEDDFTAALSIQYDNVYSYSNRASVRLQQNNISGAYADYSEVIERNTKYYDAVQRSFLARNDNNRYMENEFRDEAARIKEQIAEAYLKRAMISADYGEIGEAETNLLKGLKKAVEDFEKSRDYNPTEAPTYVNLGIVYTQLGDMELAQIAFKKAIELKKDYAEAYAYLAHNLYTINELGEAEHYALVSLKTDDNNPVAHQCLGDIYKVQRKDAAALYHYDRAVENDPYNEQLYLSRALFHKNLQEFDQAVSDFKKAIGINRESASAFNGLGTIYHTKASGDNAFDNLTVAEEHYRKAIEKNPQFAVAHRNLGYLYFELGAIYSQSGKLDEALQEFDRASKYEPNAPCGLVGKAVVLHTLGHIDEASRQIQLARQASSETFDIEWLKRKCQWRQPLLDIAETIL